MVDNNYPIIDLNEKTDLISTEVECPECGDKFRKGVPWVTIPCGNCGSSFKTDFKWSLYGKKALKINQTLSRNNGTNFRATEKYEQDIVQIKYHFDKFRSWDVTDIWTEDEVYRFCMNCGICHNCYTCKSCGHAFTKDPNLRRPRCPKCKNAMSIRTYFTEPITSEKNEYIKLCPHCKSDKLSFTLVTQKKNCHKCKSTNLSEQKNRVIYWLTVERKKSYMRENV